MTSAKDTSYRTEFFGPDYQYRVSTIGGETLVDGIVGLGYRNIAVLASHADGVALALSMVNADDNERGSTGMFLLFYVVAVLLPLLAVRPLVATMLSALNATR